MKQIELETYSKVLASANQQTRGLLDSEIIYESIICELKKTNSVIPTKEIIILFGDYVLGLRPQNNVMEELDALKVPDVYNFFTNVLSEVEQKQKAAITSTQTAPVSLTDEIKETEKSLMASGGLRTMAGDASAVTQEPETTYQSSQAEILTRPIAPLAATLPPPQNDDNRWSSES